MQAIDAAARFFRNRDVAYIQSLDSRMRRLILLRIAAANAASGFRPDGMSDHQVRQGLCRYATRHPFDIMVVSGDLIHSGYAGGFRLGAIEWVLGQLARLADHLGVRDVVVTNGNHERQEDPNDKNGSSLHDFITATNAFYADPKYTNRFLPLDPNVKFGAIARLFNYENSLVGFPPRPAKLKIVAANTVRMECNYKEDDLDLSVVSPQMRNHLRAVLGTSVPYEACDDMRIVVGHPPIEDTQAAGADPYLQRNKEFISTLEDCRVDAYLCGHRHAMKVRIGKCVDTYQCGPLVPLPAKDKRIPRSSFACYELLNGYPGGLRFLPWVSFVETAPGEHYAPMNGEETQSVKYLPDTWRCKVQEDWPKRVRHSEFHGTLGKVYDKKTSAIKSYGELFVGEGGEPKKVLYSEIYTRYIPSIIETAQPYGTREAPVPSDTLYVCHQGDFSDFLREEMTCDCFFQHLRAVLDGKIRIVRLWLNPAVKAPSDVPCPRHLEDSIVALNKEYKVRHYEDLIRPYLGDFHMDSIGLAMAGPFYHHDRAYNQDGMYRVFVMTGPLVEKLRYDSGPWSGSPRGIGVERNADIRTAIYQYMRSDDVTRGILDRLDFPTSRWNDRAFCERGSEVMLFKYSESRIEGMTAGEVVLAQKKELDSKKGEDSALDWDLYHLLKHLEAAKDEHHLDRLCPKTQSAFDKWVVPASRRGAQQ